MVFSDRLKELRNAKNLTQEQLGSRLDLTRAAISGYENGTRMPSYDLLSRIASIFNVTIDNLLGDSKTDMIDVSTLNTEQRAIIDELIKYFKAFNEVAKTTKDNPPNSIYSNIFKKYNFL